MTDNPSTSSRPVALITGAARRVGAQIARTLHRAGFDLALHYRQSAQEMTQLVAELESQRPNSTLTIAGELDDNDLPQRLVDQTIARFDRLDALINNASAFYPTPIGSASVQDWDALFASNAKAPFFLAQAAAAHLRKRQGAIVNLADIYAERPLEQHTIYCMAKAANAMLVLSLAKELAPQVRVNGIAPGAVLWPESGKTDAQKQKMLEKVPLQRAGSPEDVAEAARWLIQDAHYTTGQIIRVDGGRLLTV